MVSWHLGELAPVDSSMVCEVLCITATRHLIHIAMVRKQLIGFIVGVWSPDPQFDNLGLTQGSGD